MSKVTESRDLVQIIRDLESRIATLERGIEIKNLSLPSGGKLIVPVESSAPAGVEGQVYFDSTTNKLYVHDGVSWVALH